VENTLKSLHGVLDVKGRLIGKNLGESEIVYNPTEVTIEDFNRIVSTASGEKHDFSVVAVVEETL